MKNKAISKLENVFENMLDVIMVLSLEGHVLYANKAACLFYGYKKVEIEELKVKDIDRDISQEDIRSLLTEVLNKNIEIDVVHTKKNKERIPVKVRLMSVSSEAGRDRAVICVIHDMHTMVEENDRNGILSMSFDFVNEAIIIFEKDFSISSWNRKAEELFGLQKTDELTVKKSSIVPEDKWEELLVIYDRLKRGEMISNYLTSRCNREKIEIPVLVSYSAFYDHNRDLSAYVGIYKEITDAEIDRMKLENIQNKSMMALDGGNFGMWDYNLINNTAEVYNHIMEGGGIVLQGGNAIKQYMAEEDVEYCIDKIKLANKQNDTIDIEVRTKQQFSAKIKWVRLKGKIFEYDLYNKPVRMVGTMEDITATKKLVEDLTGKNEELKCLMESSKKADRSKSMFLANMSHEIRTSLNGIIVAAETIKKDLLSDQQTKLFSIIESSAMTLNGIVTDILDFSKIEQGKMPLNYDLIDMEEMMQTFVIEIQTAANRKGLETGFYIDNRTQHRYYADIQKIKQILNNMISNALKFTEKGSVNLKVQLQEENEEYADIIFQLADTGIGIKTELQEHIFEVFYQADESTTKSYSGTGLGLAISKKYAQAMDGRLTFTSQENVGSEFCFQCRLYKQPREASETVRSDYAEMEKIITNRKEELHEVMKKKILSIDDNMINQELIKRILEEAGYEVFLVYSPDKAMQTLAECRPDLILMDIQLPGKNGYEITHDIRENKLFQSIPIIAMTAYTRKEDEEKCRKAGMNDYVPKPLKIYTLKEKISRYIG